MSVIGILAAVAAVPISPSRSARTWKDDGEPWFVLTVEDVVYNVDVAEYIRATGP